MVTILHPERQRPIQAAPQDKGDEAFLAHMAERKNDMMNRFRHKKGWGSGLRFGNAPKLRLAKDKTGRYRWFALRAGQWVPVRTPKSKRRVTDGFFVAAGSRG